MNQIQWRLTDTLAVPATLVQHLPGGKVQIRTASGLKVVPATEVIDLPAAA